MASSKFTVGLVQMSCSTNADENVDKAVARVREAAKQGAQIVCLQELFRTQYFCQSEDHSKFALAEPIPGPTTEAMAKIARETKTVIVSSLFERRTAGVYHNTAVVLDADGSMRGMYRKMHIPDDPLYYEKFYFTPGDLGFKTFETKYAKVGTLVCWDQWYPEGARLTALQGADIIFYPTAIGWHPSEKEQYGAAQADAWRTMQRAHAISNGVYVAAVNRVGHEGPPGDASGASGGASREAVPSAMPGSMKGGIEFFGGSFVCDPFGVVLKEGSRTEEEILVVECDRARQEEVRQHWPFLRDRRIDAYAPITKRFIDE